MKQPLGDYIPPVVGQFAGMALGFFFMWGVGEAMGGFWFYGFLAGGIVGVPGGLIGSYVVYYILGAPLRREDEARAAASREKFQRIREERAAAHRRYEEERRKGREAIRDAVQAGYERDIAAGKMNYRLYKYLEGQGRLDEVGRR